MTGRSQMDIKGGNEGSRHVVNLDPIKRERQSGLLFNSPWARATNLARQIKSTFGFHVALNREPSKMGEARAYPESTNQYLYVCMHARMHACVYVCMHACLYVRMYVCTCVRVYVCTYVRMYVCTYVRMYVCMYVCMYACMYVYTY